MEFESMDNCFPTAQDDSATTFNGRSIRGLMAPTKSNGEPCGSSRRSTVTASTAGTTAPFQIPRFGTISARCGHSLRKFLSSRLTLPVVAASTAAIAWNGHLAAIPFSLVAPLLVYHTKSRKHAYASMFSYYAAASWPLIPGARAFFGVQGTPLIGLLLCLAGGALLALPWGLLFTRGRERAACSVQLCILLTAIPPLGIIGWASPLLSAGVLFPGSKWFGLALITVFLIAFRFKPALSVVSLALCALVFHFQYTQPQVPAGWEAVNTNYGGTGQGDPDFTTEYNTAQTMQTTILESHATVLLFPEHLLTHWNESTDAFWGDTLTALASQHRTVLMGAGINPPGTSRNPFAQKRYLNVLLARGEQNTALYQERIPVPIAMWRPLSDDGVPLKLFARGTIRIHNQNAAVLICYEQILVWPFLSSALEHPTVLLTASNDYWAKDTRIPAIQQSSAASWARLFHLPVLSASNF
jgi:apolipoprotein N-acyltransferase